MKHFLKPVPVTWGQFFECLCPVGERAHPTQDRGLTGSGVRRVTFYREATLPESGKCNCRIPAAS